MCSFGIHVALFSLVLIAMKQFIWFLCLLLLSVELVLGSNCVHAGHQLKVGESYKPQERCVQYTCEAPGSVQGKTCPLEATLKPCKLVGDVRKPFPDCCPKYNC